MTRPFPTLAFAVFSAVLIAFGFSTAERQFTQQDTINQEISATWER